MLCGSNSYVCLLEMIVKVNEPLVNLSELLREIDRVSRDSTGL